MSDLGQRIAKLSPEARALLERRFAEAERPAEPRIPPRGDDNPAPLSFAQQRLWVLDRLEPGKAFYNVPQVFRIRGALDVSALERALNTIRERHAVLSSTFQEIDGTPVQVAAQSGASGLSVVDLGALEAQTREKEALRIAEEEARAPFDLARGPLLRATVIRLGPDEHILLITVHHIVFDGWSGDIFDSELATLYEAYSKGRASPLSPPPIQYADFAVWQREWLRGGVLEEQLTYWKRQLQGAPEVLELFAGRSRPLVQTFRGATEISTISKPLTAAIRKVGQREGATFFMTLLAAFQVLLLRHSAGEDIVVGSPVAGRNRSDIEGLIGFFVNTLVLRTNLSGDPTFRGLLGRVREVAISAYAHQDLPFERLVEELNPERTLSHSPLFQVMVTLQNTSASEFQLPGLSVTPLRLTGETAKFDLSAVFLERGEELSVAFQYSSDLFEASTIQRMLARLQVLLEGIAEDPDRRLSELPYLTAAERHQMLVEWNDTAAEYPAASCLHELFEAEVERAPEAIAVRDGLEELSYRELNRRANGLALFLRNHGVGPEVVVGVCMPRSVRTVVALLGTLKAGGAYVPLDPSYPAQRLTFMFRDSGARLLLTEQRYASGLFDPRTEIVSLDSPGAHFSGESDANPAPIARAENLAYVIYTSGTTGTPKGVETSHRACVNRLSWTWRTYPFAAGEVCSQKTALSFVDSVGEIFGPLLRGIPSVILPDEAVRDPHALLAALAASKTTRVVLVPSLLRVLLDSGGDLARRLPLVKWWVTSGETLSLDLYRRFRQTFPEAVLINLYGSSEVSADVTCYDSRQGEPRDSVPIGRPISNTRVYILDERRQPVPLEVPGEIYIGGDALARGYRNRPELTAERFLADPFSDVGGARLFRTGDRGRYRADGQIEYLGRKDDQIKLRGHRIELGEIESVLAAHPAVGGVVAAVREEPPGEPRLVAYVVPKHGRVAVAELRRFLESRLPEFMLPSAFIFLEVLPLTRSGKIDRGALPAPGNLRPELQDVFVAPRNAVEQRIARIWSDLLGIESVGIHDNFFDLGGHSLLAVRLVAELEKNFGRQLALATIFRSPTIAELTELFKQKRLGRRSPSLVAVQPKGTRPPFFCVHANTGIVYYRALSRYLGPDQPFYGLQSQGLDGTCPPYETVEDMAAHYVDEIREFQPEGPYYLGGYSFGGKVAFEMARQLHSAGERVSVLAFFDTSNSPLTPDPTRLEFVRDRVRFHIASLKSVSRQQKFSYLMRPAKTLVLLGAGALSRAQERVFHPLRSAQRRVLGANGRAAIRYRPGFYAGHVTIFRAKDGREQLRDDRSPRDPQLGWGKLCGEGVEVREVPGGHSSMLEEESNIRALAEKLSFCLHDAQLKEAHSNRLG